MADGLGTLEELPQSYREAMARAGVTPLWPEMRNLLPHGRPRTITQACHWSFEAVRPLLLEAGDLTPVEKAERRVLVLSDPGRGPRAMQATASIYCGIQLLLPGETAPAHRHTASAARIIVEGEGGFTVVNGEKLTMSPGDLVLTPTGQWHDHGHEGSEPVIWLDALDLPVINALEGSYAEESLLQAPHNRPDSSQIEYRSAGIVPARGNRTARPLFPLMRFPWVKVEESLRAIAEYAGPEAVEIDYVNPETGNDVLPIIGFSALMLRPKEILRLPQRSASAVYHVVKGDGRTLVDDADFEWREKDSFTVPGFAAVEHRAGEEPAFLISIHDRPLQQKLGYYEERTA